MAVFVDKDNNKVAIGLTINDENIIYGSIISGHSNAVLFVTIITYTPRQT